MKDYVWFQLLIRAIGVLALALSLPNAIWTVLWSIGQFVMNDAGLVSPGDRFLAVAISLLGALAQVVVGAYLLFGGKALVSYCLTRVGGHCVRCGYDLAAVPGGVCPECGTPFRTPAGGAVAPPSTAGADAASVESPSA